GHYYLYIEPVGHVLEIIYEGWACVDNVQIPTGSIGDGSFYFQCLCTSAEASPHVFVIVEWNYTLQRVEMRIDKLRYKSACLPQIRIFCIEYVDMDVD